MLAEQLKGMCTKRRELIKKYNLALMEGEKEKAKEIGKELIKVDRIINSNS